MTENLCYKLNNRIVPRGIMIHGTGADNPYIKRYVHNDPNNRIGVNRYGNHWNHPYVEKCVHAFVGKLADDSIGVVQTLPYNNTAWHCGASGNMTHIGFEICQMTEDRKYTYAAYEQAVEYAAYLCEQFGFDPMHHGTIVSHKEGHELGIASDHKDPENWWSKYGLSMDGFRRDVLLKIQSNKERTKMNDFEKYRAELQKKPGSEWSKEAREAMVHAGLITGGVDPTTGERNYMWQDFVTREQLAQILARLENLI